jgi:hypothetical protein
MNYILGGKMKIGYGIAAVLTAVLLVSCGSGPGQPGNWGSEETNVIISATVAPIDNFARKAESPNVDVVADLCDPTDLASWDGIADHDGHMNINAMKAAEELPSGVQYIERYKVEFFTETLGAPPIETFLSGYETKVIDCSGEKCTSETPGALEFDAVLMNLERKLKYVDDVTSGQYGITLNDYPTYVAKYTFYGQDQYGNDFGFVAQTVFRPGWYLVCD